jgi:hypothetical protein
VYGKLEITPLKYWILKAMADHSKEVNNELNKILKNRNDYKILNNDFNRLEKIFIGKLNIYLLEFRNSESKDIRKEILKTKKFEL